MCVVCIEVASEASQTAMGPAFARALGPGPICEGLLGRNGLGDAIGK